MHCVRRREKRRLTLQALQKGAPELRTVVFIRDGGKCWYCGMATRLRDGTLDHQVSVKYGGLPTLKNLVWCCADCNHRKGHRSLADFRVACGETSFWGERHGV